MSKSKTEHYQIAQARPVNNVLLLSVLAVPTLLIVWPLPFIAATPPPLPALYTSLAFSIVACVAVIWLIPKLGASFVKIGLKGRDLLKNSNEDVPESIGLVCASVYILLLILFIPFVFSDFFAHNESDNLEGLAASSLEFPHRKLAVYLSAILSLLIATLLGFLDDLFDIRWRHKVPIPVLASIPLLMVYFAEKGSTHIVIPIPFRKVFGTVINLGPLYYIYMALFSTFTTNSINILAGINASEVSQALIIAVSIVLNDMLYLPWSFRLSLHFHLPLFHEPRELTLGGVYGAGLAHGSKELVERHLLSSYFMLPLIGVCLGFLYHNWYPARVFPGDTLCYVTGMAFAVVGILGHFSKTLWLFLVPQIFNAIFSAPQIFGLVPCPRHRVPRPDHSTLLLHPSQAQFLQRPNALTSIILRIFSALGLVKLTYDSEDPTYIRTTTNMTILNAFLVLFGPMNEKNLVRVLIVVQMLGSIVAFGVRYGLAGLVYDGDRR